VSIAASRTPTDPTTVTVIGQETAIVGVSKGERLRFAGVKMPPNDCPAVRYRLRNRSYRNTLLNGSDRWIQVWVVSHSSLEFLLDDRYRADIRKRCQYIHSLN
jgi:hypothetical protein